MRGRRFRSSPLFFWEVIPVTISEKERRWERKKDVLIRKQKIREEKAEIQKKSKLPT